MYTACVCNQETLISLTAINIYNTTLVTEVASSCLLNDNEIISFLS